MDVMKNIQELLPELTQTQTKIANYILENPNVVCFSSLKNLAEEIGVTETTILNFCKRTEYESFAGVKKALGSYIQDRMFWNAKMETKSAQYSADVAMVENLKQNQGEVLNTTLGSLDEKKLFDFVETLSKAKVINICAHSISVIAANNLYAKLRSVGAVVRLIDVSDYTAVLNMLTEHDDNDVFVLITLPYYSVQTIAISDYLASVDATVLALTDKMSSPIAKNAKHVLLCNSQHLVFHNSFTALIALGDIIAGIYFLQNKDRFNAYNEKVKVIEEFFQTATVPAYDNEYFYQ